MAKIDVSKMEKLNGTRNRVHDEVDATYSVFESFNEKILQIDTYGSSGREVKGVPSQKIQIDRKSAELLVEILKKEFYIF